MKKILLPVLAVLMSATAFTAANAANATTTTTTTNYHSETYYKWNPFGADVTGLYVAGAAGATMPTDGFDDDAVYSVSLGWQFHPMIRTELEGSFRETDVDGAPGDAKTYTYFLNGIWDIKNDTRFTPYIGAGAGWAYTKLDTPAISESESEFAYQGIAGVSYAIDNNWALTAQYNYVDTLDGDFAAGDADFKSHEVKAGVRYTF